MAGKKILYQDDARRSLIKGMNIMVEAVSVTLGPKGRNVIILEDIIDTGITIEKIMSLLAKEKVADIS